MLLLKVREKNVYSNWLQKLGTGDDLPPNNQNRGRRVGRVAGNGRSSIAGSAPHPRFYNDMEAQIHHLEQDAYISILRAFKVQSDAISWEKESLMTELRRELRVSDEEHRELLGRVNADDIVIRIREWRKAGHQPGMLTTAQPTHDAIVATFRKKQKISNSVPSLSLNPHMLAASMQPTLTSGKRGVAVGARGKKPKSGQPLPGVSLVKPVQYPLTGPAGRGFRPNRGLSGALVTNGRVGAGSSDPYIGRKVMTRWPEDNNFYEAVITDYDPIQGLHALVYDMHTNDEAFEWVNLNEISPEDIRWEGENMGISRKGGRGMKKSMDHDGVVPWEGREDRIQPEKDLLPLQNTNGKKNMDDIEMILTETVVKEVEKVFLLSRPDPLEIEKAMTMLKNQEKTLIDTLARIADASDGESDDGKQANTHGPPMGRDLVLPNKQHDISENGMVTEGEGRGICDNGHTLGTRNEMMTESGEQGFEVRVAASNNDEDDEMVIVDV
ncbi:protein EMSY-LIKE 3-like isoform X4 [Papaver somniferum]|uniref:protein EMSY-LIKE 3-like isoform X4 n=1 Tax=Papaver somniferum TaxID=3469 RepID=UPI000E6FD6BC|nr:protein EMSY-LIKE 3-like isoform X4 [Papaver somniferum]